MTAAQAPPGWKHGGCCCSAFCGTYVIVDAVVVDGVLALTDCHSLALTFSERLSLNLFFSHESQDRTATYFLHLFFVCLLCAFIDSVSVSGTRVYTLPIRANVFGPPERAAATIAALAR